MGPLLKVLASLGLKAKDSIAARMERRGKALCKVVDSDV
jgi:hypothetical protein